MLLIMRERQKLQKKLEKVMNKCELKASWENSVSLVERAECGQRRGGAIGERWALADRVAGAGSLDHGYDLQLLSPHTQRAGRD